MNAAADAQELKTSVDDAVMTIFDHMIGIMIDPSRCGAIFNPAEIQVIGMVAITGAAQAIVCLRVSPKFSSVATAAMFGLEPASVTEPDINDVVGELTNMIAGKIKANLRTEGELCSLSLPTIIRGTKVDLESVSGVQRHSYTFHDPNGAVVLEIYALNQEEKNHMNNHNPKILLVDDSRATRAVVAKMLSGHHCEIIEATNGAAGLDMARLHQPGLIVLDMTMPIMNGIETLERLKADAVTKAIPVIMLSANSNPEEVEQMKGEGLVLKNWSSKYTPNGRSKFMCCKLKV